MAGIWYVGEKRKILVSLTPEMSSGQTISTVTLTPSAQAHTPVVTTTQQTIDKIVTPVGQGFSFILEPTTAATLSVCATATLSDAQVIIWKQSFVVQVC